jgi:hypothetical protein
MTAPHFLQRQTKLFAGTLANEAGADGTNGGSGGIRIPDREFEEIGAQNRGKIPSLRNAQENFSEQTGQE